MKTLINSGRMSGWFGLVVLAGIMAINTGCERTGIQAAGSQSNSRDSDNNDSRPQVQTYTVKQQDLEQQIELPGTVRGYESADLYAKVGGYLQEISVDIGDEVTRGQVLAQLWIPEMEKQLSQKEAAVQAAQAEVQQAEAAIEQAEAQVESEQAAVEEARAELEEKRAQVDRREAEYTRVSDLVQRGSLNQEVLDETVYKRDAARAALNAVQAKIRSAEARLNSKKTDVRKAKADHQTALAQVNLSRADYQRVKTLSEYGTIKAPFDGVITRRMVHPGAFIQPAEGNSSAMPLVSIERIDVVRISLHLPMAQVRWLNQGDKATLDRINVLPGESFEGEVARFARSLDERSRMMRVEIDLQNPEERLLPGYYGYVTLHLEEMPGTPVIPSSALLTEDNEDYVLVVENGVIDKRSVKTNYKDGAIVGIESGVSPGEQIIQAGGGLLIDGQKVIARNGG